MAEPALAVRRRSRISSARKRSHPPAQPGATSSPLARKRPSGGGEGTPAEPLCNNDSEEDMFGDYDSFHESDSLLAQVLDAEPQHSQEKGLDVKAAGGFAHGDLQLEMDQSKQGNLHAAGDSSVRKVDEHYGFQMNENDAGDADEDLSDSVFDELPSSQLLYLEKTRELSSRSQRSL